MKSALEMSVPHKMPHVSKFRRVFGCAMFRKVVRSSGGRRTVRRGAPDSVKAFGWKVYLAEGGCDPAGGEGVAVGGLGGWETLAFAGTGGANASRWYGAGSSSCFAGNVGGTPGIVGLG